MYFVFNSDNYEFNRFYRFYRSCKKNKFKNFLYRLKLIKDEKNLLNVKINIIYKAGKKYFENGK